MKREQLTIFDAEAVREGLSYAECIGAVRGAMEAFSAGRTRQLLRSVIALGPERMFGQMPGALGEHDMFGAKMISVFGDPDHPGQRRHKGVVMLFEPDGGEPVAIADAEEITHIRTAAATAVATDALARPDARTLLIVGTGGQAFTHLRALPLVRDFERVMVWGRSAEKAQRVIDAFPQLPMEFTPDLETAAGQADVICTLTTSAEPVLLGAWLQPGTHINLVGSSVAGPVEVDSALVANSRFVADSRASVLEAGAEFIAAKAAGLIDDDHIVAEIGEVLLGEKSGRRSAGEITVYKSLGHAVQDLAAVAHLYRKAKGL